MSKARAIQCPYCAEICLGKQSLEFHFEQSHPGDKFKCPVCNAGYTLSDDLFNHLRTQHDYPAESPPLERPLSKSSSDYLMTYPKHDCPFCDKGGFSSADVLEIHVRTLHADKLSQVNICSYCNTIYQTLSELEEHIKLQHSNGMLKVKFTCDLCSQECSTYEALQLHKDSVHYKDYSKSFYKEEYPDLYKELYKDVKAQCSICGAAYSNMSALSEHIMTSHGINLSLKSPSPGSTSNGSVGKKTVDLKLSPSRPSIPQSPKINR